jgi:hypothetical protein
MMAPASTSISDRVVTIIATIATIGAIGKAAFCQDELCNAVDWLRST